VPGYSTSYNNDRYSSEVDAFTSMAPLGEILDAFVWANLDLATRPVNVKSANTTQYWVRALLLCSQAIILFPRLLWCRLLYASIETEGGIFTDRSDFS